MAAIKIFCGILAFLILLELASAFYPPELPILLQGKVVSDKGAAIGGVEVTASWSDAAGNLKQASTKTFSAAGNSELLGYYKFDAGVIDAPEGSEISLESRGAEVSVDAVSGTILIAPDIVVSSKGFWGSLVDSVKGVFGLGEKRESSEKSEVNSFNDSANEINLSEQTESLNDSFNQTDSNSLNLSLDEEGYSDDENYSGDISSNTENKHSPSIVNLASEFYVCENSLFDASFEIVDLDRNSVDVWVEPNDTLSISRRKGVNQSVGLARIYSSGLGKNKVGAYLAKVYASDGGYLTSKEIIINVIGVNNAPVFKNLENKLIEHRGNLVNFSYNLLVEDVEDGGLGSGKLSFTSRSLIGEEGFKVRGNGEVSGEVNRANNGFYRIEVCVSDRGIEPGKNISLCKQDGKAISVCKNLSITVTDSNRVPFIVSFNPKKSNLTVQEESTKFEIASKDPDNALVDVYWYTDGVLEKIDFGNSRSEFSYLGCNSLGKHLLRAELSDGFLNNSVEWEIYSERCSEKPRGISLLAEKFKGLFKLSNSTFLFYVFVLVINLVLLYVIFSQVIKSLKLEKEIKKPRNSFALRKINALFLLTFFLVSFSAGVVGLAPPELPILLQGKVVSDKGAAIQGVEVTASWSDASGNLKQASTKTFSAAGNSELLGYYKFDAGVIDAPEGSEISLESRGAEVSVDAVSGTILIAPDIVVSSKGFWGGFFDTIKSFFGLGEKSEISEDEKKVASPRDYLGNGSGYSNYSASNSSYSGETSGSGEAGIEGNGSEGVSGGEARKTIPQEGLMNSQPYTSKLKLGENVGEGKNVFYNIKEYLAKQEYQNKFWYVAMFLAIILGIILLFFVFALVWRFFKKLYKKSSIGLKNSIRNIGEMSASEFMNSRFRELGQDDSVFDALSLFVSSNISVIPVVSSNRVVGVLVKNDLIKKIGDTGYEALTKKKIREVMSKEFFSCDISTSFREVYNILIEKRLNFIIVEKKGEVRGVLDFLDMIHVFERADFIIVNPPIMRNAMSGELSTIESNKTLLELRNLFLKGDAGYALVMKQKKLAGIVSEKDLIIAMYQGRNLGKTFVNNIMSINVSSMKTGEYLSDALKLVSERKFNQIPVVVNKVEGIVSLRDLVRTYYEFLNSKLVAEKV